MQRYRTAHRAAETADDANRSKPYEQWSSDEREPRTTDETLRREIEEREGAQRVLFETRIWWALAFVTAIAGVVIHRRGNAWLGLAFSVTGFAEMIWWCTPSWFIHSSTESDHLVGTKLVLSVVTLILLATTARVLKLIGREHTDAQLQVPG